MKTMWYKFNENGAITRALSRCPDDMNNWVSDCNIDPTLAHNYYYNSNTRSITPKPSCPSPNHIFDYTTKQWVDPRSLSELKLSKWSEIKKERDTTETSGFIWNSLVFDSDTKSQQRIQSAAQQAQLNRTLIFNWVLANNESVELTSIQIWELYIQLGKFIQANFEKARVIRNQIELCNTTEELSNISWY
jgi:hypothetical protein